MDDYLSVKWLWLYMGIFLMLMEIMTPGFVVFFFGLAAAAVGGILFLFDFSGTLQAALFSGLSILFLLTLRRFMLSAFMGNTSTVSAIEHEHVGRTGKVVEAIRPMVAGRVLIGDAEWVATAEESLEPGAEVRVVAQKSLTLIVEKL